MKLAVLQAVLAARKSKTPLAVVTRLADGAQALVWRDRAEGALTLGDAALVEEMLAGRRLGAAAQTALRVQPDHDPQPRLVSLMRGGVIVGITEVAP